MIYKKKSPGTTPTHYQSLKWNNITTGHKQFYQVIARYATFNYADIPDDVRK